MEKPVTTKVFAAVFAVKFAMSVAGVMGVVAMPPDPVGGPEKAAPVSMVVATAGEKDDK